MNKVEGEDRVDTSQSQINGNDVEWKDVDASNQGYREQMQDT